MKSKLTISVIHARVIFTWRELRNYNKIITIIIFLLFFFFFFKGGISDGIICSTPGIRKGKDLLKVPYELFGACPLTTAHVHLTSIHHHNFEHRSSLKHAHHNEHAENSWSNCDPKPKPRPVSLRHAIATVVITGVVCGIVCLMMLAAAVYGCAYAAITAKYHREHLAPARQHGTPEEKEPFNSSLAWVTFVFGFSKIKSPHFS